MLEEALTSILKQSTHLKELRSVMEYATLPPGKLFRPRLVEALAQDIDKNFSKNHQHLALAIELHHAYTLVHDDLPSMDNDLMRRGKPSTHAQFGEWQAILAGDALLIQSFQELHKISHETSGKVFKLFGWATGAKGLIEGQFRDLSLSTPLNVNEVLRIHELKTARLVQVATVGTYLLSSLPKKALTRRKHLRLGRDIGLSFQLLDDLSDLTGPEVSSHEKAINPFLMNPEEALSALTLTHLRLKKNLDENHLEKTSVMLTTYFKQSQKELLSALGQIEKKFEMKFWIKDLENWLTNFV